MEQALREAARQVEALVATGAKTEQQHAAAFALLQRIQESTAPLTLSAPAVQGEGVAATRADSLVVRGVRPGTYTVLGDGTALGGTSDNGVYACAATASSVASFTCRLTGLANVNCPQLSPWCKAGLMIRGDLSDDAPMVLLGATGGNGMLLEQRVAPLLDATSANGTGGGLLTAGQLTSNLKARAGNYLIRAVWLKLRRDGLTLTAYTSADGHTWVQAGPPVVVRAGAAWVGLVAGAHNGDFNGKGYIRAQFDNLSFTAAAVYQIGASGVPPAAGPVPSSWAGA